MKEKKLKKMISSICMLCVEILFFILSWIICDKATLILVPILLLLFFDEIITVISTSFQTIKKMCIPLSIYNNHFEYSQNILESKILIKYLLINGNKINVTNWKKRIEKVYELVQKTEDVKAIGYFCQNENDMIDFSVVIDKRKVLKILGKYKQINPDKKIKKIKLYSDSYQSEFIVIKNKFFKNKYFVCIKEFTDNLYFNSNLNTILNSDLYKLFKNSTNLNHFDKIFDYCVLFKCHDYFVEKIAESPNSQSSIDIHTVKKMINACEFKQITKPTNNSTIYKGSIMIH